MTGRVKPVKLFVHTITPSRGSSIRSSAPIN